MLVGRAFITNEVNDFFVFDFSGGSASNQMGGKLIKLQYGCQEFKFDTQIVLVFVDSGVQKH